LQDKVDAGERAIEEVTLEALKSEDVLSNIKQSTVKFFKILNCDPKPVQAIIGEVRLILNCYIIKKCIYKNCHLLSTRREISAIKQRFWLINCFFLIKMEKNDGENEFS